MVRLMGPAVVEFVLTGRSSWVGGGRGNRWRSGSGMGVCGKCAWSARQASGGTVRAMVTSSAGSPFADEFFVAQSDVSREGGHGPFVRRA